MFCVQFVVFCRILCSDCGALFGWVACSKQQIVSNRRKLTREITDWNLRSTVRLGEWDASKPKDCDLTDPEDPECADPVQDIRVSGFVAHPQYDASRIINDIGFVHLAEAANFKQNNIKPICMPFTIELQQLPARLIVIGWGRTEKSRSAEILQKAGVPLFDQDKCVEKFSSLSSRRKLLLTDGQFCAGAEGLGSWWICSAVFWWIVLISRKGWCVSRRQRVFNSVLWAR